MKFAAFVALRAQVHFVLTRAELTEILGGLGDAVGKEVHFDPA